MNVTEILMTLGAGLIGAFIAFLAVGKRKRNESEISAKADRLLAKAQEEAKNIVAEAFIRADEMKKQLGIEQKEFSEQLGRMEKMLDTKINSSQKRESKIAELKQALQKEEQSVSQIKFSTAETEKQIADKLIASTGLNHEVAKQKVLAEFEQAFKRDAELRLTQEMEWAQERANREAKNVLAETIYRYGAATSVEHEQSEIKVSRDEIKGKIIGRGGRNIAYFEELFGVDVVFNDEPNTIIVSCFNLVQREIARAALERLLREKNINEEIIQRIKTLAEQDVAKILRKEGEKVLQIMGVKNMSPDFAKLLGRLNFRTSYGQNVLRHSFEVGYFSRLIASEIGANAETTWIAGVFHDIGKAVDQEVGGSHDALTKEILEKYNFPPEIVHAAWTHHNSAPQETVEARIIQAADALSAGRPGARAESLERYLAKIKELQDTALSFDGVKKAYAINAGREVRVIVDEAKIDDAGAKNLAQGIAGKVQEKGGYPGKIKVVTIRTTKASNYAKSTKR